MIGKTNSKTKSDSSSEFVNVLLFTNQLEHSDLIGAIFNMNYGTYNLNYTWNGSEITFSVPAHVSCTIEFPSVEGYKKPDNITFVAVEGNSRTIEAEYKAELVKVNVTSSNDSAVSGATLTINGKQQTWNGTEIRQLVPFGTQYSVVAGAVSGFGTPSTQTFTAQQTEREVSVLYVESSLVVNILSNQGTDSSINGVKATVSYGSSSVQVSNGQKISLPTGVSVTISFPNVSGYKKPSNITFTHTGGVVTKSGTYQCELLTVNVKADSGSVSGYKVTIASSSTTFGTQTSVTGKYKIPFGTSYTISTTSVSGYTTPSTITRTAKAKSYTASVLYKIQSKDLSKFDIYGNSISQTTANCYVVKEVGYYKIPLVFGNSLKGGSTNSAAYTKNSAYSSHDFVDFKGTIVTSPYIENVSGTAASAQLSIADTDGIFTDIIIVDGSPCRYLQFKVNSVPATGANGVLSIKNSSGVIMWSWHIWVWDDSLATVEITNSTGVKYNIMPVNLASKWDDTAKTKIKNWFYQFGRPNPMLCPSTYDSTSNHASYGALSFAVASIASNIQTGIKNPATFYKRESSNYNNWFKTDGNKTYSLWDAACEQTGTSDNDVVKTIYDPSPIGFKTPNGNAFTGLSMISNSNGIMKFARYSGDSTGVGFPMSGCRDNSNGSLLLAGSYGHVWTAALNSTDNIYLLRFYSVYSGEMTGVNPHYTYSPSFGFSVRPVQE